MPLQYRKGICDCHGEERFIVKRLPSGNYCKEGNDERLASRKDSAPKPRIKREKLTSTNTKQKELFLKLWSEREKVSFLSGKPLSYLEFHKDKKETAGLFYSIFAHVLPKGLNKYPKFKLYEKNIVFLTPDEHRLFDHGSKSQRERYAKENNCDWNKLYELAEELKEEY